MDDRSFLDIKLEQLSRQYVTTYVKGQLTDSLFVRLQKEFGGYETQLKDLTRNYILNNTNNISGVYLFIQNSFLFPPETQKEIIANGGEFFEHNPAIQTFSKLLSMNKNVEIGMPYINLKMQTPSGSPVTLSDYIQKGKYVLIDFWASWCAPCCKQMPELIKIYDRFKNKNFEIVGVSFDNNKNEWVEYIHENFMASNVRFKRMGFQRDYAICHSGDTTYGFSKSPRNYNCKRFKRERTNQYS